jgi:hypothetical protein
VFREACKLGCEGIVSKRLGSPYRFRAIGALGEGQKPESASSEARSRRGLGTVESTRNASPYPAVSGLGALEYLRLSPEVSINRFLACHSTRFALSGVLQKGRSWVTM